MSNFDYSELREYWKLKIKSLLAYKVVDNANLDDPDWENKLDTLIYRQEINQFAIDVCYDIYDKATVNKSPFPSHVNWRMPNNLVNDEPKDTALQNKYWDTFWDYVEEWEKFTQYNCWLLDVLKYNPTADDLSPTDSWKDLKPMLNGLSIETIINQRRQLCRGIGDVLGLTVIPIDWKDKIAKKEDLDNANSKISNLQTKADEYDRIHSKLGGRVSDSQLDNLLAPPPCSHTDYDAIKTERDAALTNLTTITSERDAVIIERDNLTSQLTAKESTIIEKIITDCELGTDTEKTLEKVIIRIKQLIKDNDTINPTVKSEVVKISKELGLGNDFQTKISETTTYSNLIDIQKQAFTSKLSESSSEVSKYKTRSNWATAVGGLSFAATLILTYLLLRKNQEETKEEIND